MLENLDLDHVGLATAVVRPDFLLPEPNAVQRQRRQPAAHLRQLLRVRKRAADALDLADAAAYVVRRADVAEGIGLHHLHHLSDLVFSAGHATRPPPSCAPAPRW